MNTRLIFTLRSALLTLSAVVLVHTVSAYAQEGAAENTPSLIGEINIEDSGPQRDSYADIQRAAIGYFKKLASITGQLGQGAVSASVPAMDDNTLTYLNALYLYCAVNYGECPLLLDGILETDIINSRVAKRAECPNMTRFWKLWVKSDMEARHKYMVRTGYLKVTSDFNEQKRPAYLKCQETVGRAIAGSDTNEAFFKERYRADSAHALIAARNVKLLEEISAKVPNIFAAVGTTLSSQSETGAGSGAKAERRRR
jgi:hypothetical protein